MMCDLFLLMCFFFLYFGVSIQSHFSSKMLLFMEPNQQVRKAFKPAVLCLFVPLLYRSKKGLTTLRFWQAGEYDTSFRSPLTSQSLRVTGSQDARLVSRCHCGRCKLTLNFQHFKAPLRCFCAGCRHFHSSSFGAYLPLESLPDWQTGAPWIVVDGWKKEGMA